MMITAPIPNESSKGKGPMGLNSLFSKPNSDAILKPLLHSIKVLPTVLVSDAQKESRFARLMSFSILTS